MGLQDPSPWLDDSDSWLGLLGYRPPAARRPMIPVHENRHVTICGFGPLRNVTF